MGVNLLGTNKEIVNITHITIPEQIKDEYDEYVAERMKIGTNEVYAKRLATNEVYFGKIEDVMRDCISLFDNRKDVFDNGDNARIQICKDFVNCNLDYKIAMARTFSLLEGTYQSSSPITNLLDFAEDTLQTLHREVNQYEMNQRMMNPDDYVFEDVER